MALSSGLEATEALKDPVISEKDCSFNGLSYEDFSRMMQEGIDELRRRYETGEISDNEELFAFTKSLFELRVDTGNAEVGEVGLIQIIQGMDFSASTDKSHTRISSLTYGSEQLFDQKSINLSIGRGSPLAKAIQLLALTANHSSQFEQTQDVVSMIDGKIGLNTQKSIERFQIQLETSVNLQNLKNRINDKFQDLKRNDKEQDEKISNVENKLSDVEAMAYQNYEQGVKGLFSDMIQNIELTKDNNTADQKQRQNERNEIPKREQELPKNERPNNVEVDAQKGLVEIRTYGNYSTFNLKTGTITVFPKDGEVHEFEYKYALDVDDDHTLLKGLPMLSSKRNKQTISNAMQLCNLTNFLISYGGDISGLIDKKKFNPYTLDTDGVLQGLEVDGETEVYLETLANLLTDKDSDEHKLLAKCESFKDFMNKFFELRYYEAPSGSKSIYGNHREW